MKTNTNIYKDPTEAHIFDLSRIGTILVTPDAFDIYQENHCFEVGEVLYFDITKKMFDRAIAQNTIESEVCGIVSKVIDKNTFKMTNNGFIQTTKFDFILDSPLYLSETTRGKIMSTTPRINLKQVAIQKVNGIQVKIDRGFQIQEDVDYTGELEPYTKDELDEIIKNIW